MRVFLVRHTSVDVPAGTCYGHTDVPLAATFPEEAEVVKQRLDALNVKFNAVYSSPLSRAWKLADYCGFPNPVWDDRLKELNFGDWEMQLFDEIKDPHIQEWYDDYLHVPCTNGESFQDQLHRVGLFLEDLKKKHAPDENIVVFAHGGILTCALLYMGKTTLEEAFSNILPYGSVIELSIIEH